MARVTVLKSSTMALSLLLLVGNVADAFAPASPGRSSSMATATEMATKDDSHTNNNPISGIVGAFGLAAVVFTSGDKAASAYVPPPAVQVIALQSSTIQLSEAIKTMDFSMPSSYDSIADVKSKATDELTMVENVRTGTQTKVASSTPKKAMTSEEKAAMKAAQEAQKAALAAEKAAEREAAQAEAAAKQRAAAALKAAAAAEKAAAAKATKAAAEEKAQAKKASAAASSMEFVDMGLPSYGESAKTESKKSAFSL